MRIVTSLAGIQATACGMIYPCSEEEGCISWKIGFNGNFSIKKKCMHGVGSLRIKAASVDWFEIFSGSRFIPKRSALDRGLVFLECCQMHTLLDSNIHSHNTGEWEVGNVEFASMGQN
ncbi:hypothetical protein IMY05_006G0081700 [Salix suchowensis]|nr:hypothetical protein IMY05_006G0081700 [Salix suchowensis]